MARKSDIQSLLDVIGFKTSEWKSKTIAEETADIGLFDLRAATDDLAKIAKPSVTDIINAIRANQTYQTYCGNCRQGRVPVLDYYAWNEAGQPDLYQRKVFLPIMEMPCPKCQPHAKTSISERISKMTEAERGWTYCILYKFYVYNLQNTCTIAEFNPADIWGVFSTEPHLTGAMMDFMGWVHDGMDRRLKQAEEKAGQVIHNTATARAFG